ncbi:MAG TPA: hydrogenase expression protein HypE [Gammaproteobacteria bacterium]|nr:hydrogenase expression protein HypE [Gammaproteobacteria bacterium]
MAALVDAIPSRRLVEEHRPWPRAVVDADTWRWVAGELAAGRQSLLGLWGEPAGVHMAVLDQGEVAVVSLDCPDGVFPSVGARHAPALRLERAIRDLFGLEPATADGSALDARPWLDHGRWGIAAPLGRGPSRTPPRAPGYTFLPVEGESLHEIAVGPVHAGVIEPGHFRFTAAGETLVRLEQRFGYVHKGIEGLMAGADLPRALELAGRTSGDSAVAYALAFSRAAEAALGVDVPPRAEWLRALMAELERLANHVGDIGAVCNDASFALMHAHCAVLREQVLRAAGETFGHRFMRDRVVPGGVAVDLDAEGRARIAALIAEIRRRFPHLVELYDKTASLQDRTVGTGIVLPELAREYAAGGYVGRASGRSFDARRSPGYAPYDELELVIPVLAAGDVDARVLIRIREVEQSLTLVEQILARMPEGELRTPVPRSVPAGAGEGMALVEGFRGDVLVWLKLAPDTSVARCHLRDPSWFQWPLVEAAIEGNIIADFPLCNKSFNCSYSGHDL